MEELKLDGPKQIKLIVDGKEYILSQPTVGAVRRMNRSLSEAKTDEEKLEVNLQFLVASGLPEEVLDALAVSELELVSDILTDVKKKS
jgi:hypothetical protein